MLQWRRIVIALGAITALGLAVLRPRSRPPEPGELDRKLLKLEQKLAQQTDEIARLANQQAPAYAYASPPYNTPSQPSPSASATPQVDNSQGQAEGEQRRQAYVDHLEAMVQIGSRSPAGRGTAREVESVLATVVPSVRAQVECEAVICRLNLRFRDLTRHELIQELFMGADAPMKSAGMVASADEQPDGERRLVLYISRGQNLPPPE